MHPSSSSCWDEPCLVLKPHRLRADLVSAQGIIPCSSRANTTPWIPQQWVGIGFPAVTSVHRESKGGEVLALETQGLLIQHTGQHAAAQCCSQGLAAESSNPSSSCSVPALSSAGVVHVLRGQGEHCRVTSGMGSNTTHVNAMENDPQTQRCAHPKGWSTIGTPWLFSP